MSEHSSQDLPPLGEPTPALAGPSRPWYQAPVPVGILGLVLGLVLGAIMGAAVGNGAESEGGTEVATDNDTSAQRGTTTSVPTAPPECVEALRSAEQALQLVQQGVQSLRHLRVDDVDRTISDLDRLRSGFSSTVGRCQDRLGGSG